MSSTVDSRSWESALPEDLLDRVESGAAAPTSGPTAAPKRHRLLEHRWWSLVAWTAGLVIGAGALSDNSFLTHVATGRLIRAGGAPTHDLFTYASGGKPVVVQSWLASWIYATLEAIGGGGAIRLFVALVTAVLMVTLWRLSAPAGALLGRVALVAMAGMVGLLWWNERPQIIAFAALALIALVLAEERSPWWLVSLFAIWVNVHGSFPLGVLFVGAVSFVRVVGQRRIRWREVQEVAAVVVGVVAGAAVSPYGFQMITFPIRMLARTSSLQFITEWRPLTLGSFNNVVFLAEAVAIVGLLAWRHSWLRLLVAAVFIGLALMAVRNVVVAALVLIPLAAPAFAGLGTPDRGGALPRRRLLALGAAVTALVGLYIGMTPSYDLGAYPTKAVDWLETHGYVGRTDGHNAKILTHDYSGNYLEWRFGTRARPWLDDRAELHSYENVRDYVFLLSAIGNTDQLLARHRGDLIMWATRTPLARHLEHDADYAIVYRDPSTIIARHR